MIECRIFSLLEYLCMTRQTKSTVFWKRRMLSKSNICVKATFLANVCRAIFALIVFCFVENIFVWILFCGKHVCFNSCSESAQIISTIQPFLQIFHFVDIKFVKSEQKKRINNIWWKNIIWWKQHHLIDSRNFSSLNFFLVDEFIN